MLIAVLAAFPAAGPASAKPGPVDPPGGQSCTLKPSQPFVSAGPTKTSVGKYAFTVEAVALMDCNFIPYAFSVTSVLHNSMDGVTGANRSSTVSCANHTYCEANAFLTREGLLCGFTYNYDDYTQATGWYKATSSSGQTTLQSVNSSHSRGSSHNPPGVC
ncbi:hypothetical protein ACQP2P_16260 [Dactylosporangium sp. CA-139114]|uniref:hypothetical protein n=1 Tax=Dactylosporangium sp. CA-139114 TaxID=3239931 RepID=UPI003D983A8B